MESRPEIKRKQTPSTKRRPRHDEQSSYHNTDHASKTKASQPIIGDTESGEGSWWDEFDIDENYGPAAVARVHSMPSAQDPPPVYKAAEYLPEPDVLARPDSAIDTPTTTTTASSSTNTTAPGGTEKSFWQNALTETRHFAGGLISHPFESTKHFTILRHSPSIVFYRGPSTSVAVTIFSSSSSKSDTSVPRDRTVWLQQRGLSGNTGMKLERAVGATGTWLDVTPAAQAAAGDVGEADERGRQRDIEKFLKKAARDKSLASRVPRQTCIIRIPAAASDGYFRLVLCAGGGAMAGQPGGGRKATRRRVLCPSPIFRIASTSADSSVFKGANLKTLPLEIGVKVASTVANNAVMRYVSPVASTATAAVQGRMKKYQPGARVTEYATTAYGATGLQGKIAVASEQYDQRRDMRYEAFEEMVEGAELPVDMVGSDEGPELPFPIKFQGKVVKGTGRSGQELGVPTANLADVPDDIKFRLKGVYMGWACIISKKALDGISTAWHEAVVTVGPSPYTAPSIVAKKSVTVHLLHDFGGNTFLEAKVKTFIMGFLRPLKEPGTGKDELLDSIARDTQVTISSLSRENWGPEKTQENLKTLKSARTFSDKYIEARDMLQKRADNIPIHLAGVRTAGAELRDRTHGNGGLWIAR